MKAKIKNALELMNDDELDALLEMCEAKQDPNEERKIKYDVVFNRPNNYKPQEISFDEINNYDFSKGFTEYTNFFFSEFL